MIFYTLYYAYMYNLSTIKEHIFFTAESKLNMVKIELCL